MIGFIDLFIELFAVPLFAVLFLMYRLVCLCCFRCSIGLYWLCLGGFYTCFDEVAVFLFIIPLY